MIQAKLFILLSPFSCRISERTKKTEEWGQENTESHGHQPTVATSFLRYRNQMEKPQEIGKPQRKAFSARRRSESKVASSVGPLHRVAKPDAGGTESRSFIL